MASIVDLGLQVEPDASFPTNYDTLVPLVLAEFAELPEEQQRMFRDRPVVIGRQAPMQMRVALFAVTDKHLAEFIAAYNERKQAADATAVVPPLRQLINLTHTILRYPTGAIQYGSRVNSAFALISTHWFSVSSMPLPWGHMMARLYTLITNPSFPALRLGFSTSAYYHEFYRAWKENTEDFKTTIMPMLTPRLRYLICSKRRSEYEEIMQSFSRAEPHMARGDITDLPGIPQ